MADLEFTANGGRKRPPYTDVPDWVGLSGVRAKAAFLYWVIKMHVFVRTGDNSVRVSTDTLAGLCQLGRGDRVKPYVDELVDIGALSVGRVGYPARNVYILHDDPPEGYGGPLTLRQWYDMRKLAVTLRSGPESVENPANPQVSADPHETGDQGTAPVDNDEDRQVSADPQKIGEQAQIPENSGVSDPRKIGDISIQPASSVQRATSPPAPSGSSTSPEEGRQEEERDLIKENPTPDRAAAEVELLAEIAAAGRAEEAWSIGAVSDVLAHPRIRARRWDLVEVAFRIAVRDDSTWTPTRLLKDACPHWRQADAELRRRAAATARPPHSPLPVWCGHCVKATRMISLDQLDPNGSPRTQVACPTCSPTLATV